MIRDVIFMLALLSFAVPAAASAPPKPTASAMSDAATSFLATLDAAQKAKVALDFNDKERFNWHFVPKARKGLSLGEMNAAQQKAALDLLRAGLSEKGYTKATLIRELEPVLRAIENDNPTRDPGRFHFTIFGVPSAGGTWGWRYEGHHCSQNGTIVGGKVIASSPQFFGANPATVPSGPKKGLRVLAVEEDLARTLVQSLADEQKRKAVVNTKAPGDIITGNQRQIAIQEDRGIAYKELTPPQQGMLLALIEEHANAPAPAIAKRRLQKIHDAGLDGIKFAWMGGLEKGQGHYYRIQGSTFLIEYDNTQNNANHVHTVWRDFKGDFGRDLLEQHYHEFPHHDAEKK